MLSDIKIAFRQLSKSRGFALTVMLTMGLGIGATSAIFSLVHQVLLKSLPVADPAGLWRVGDNEQCCINSGLPDYTSKPDDWSLFSYLQYAHFRDQTPEFDGLAAFEAKDREMAVQRAGSTHPAQPYYGEFVSGNSFDVLGLRAYAGRLLEPADDVKGAAPVAVMSFQAWEQLGRDPSVVGSGWQINGHTVTVVGVAPPGFYGERLSATPPSFWMPHSPGGDAAAARCGPVGAWRTAVAEPDWAAAAGSQRGRGAGAYGSGTAGVSAQPVEQGVPCRSSADSAAVSAPLARAAAACSSMQEQYGSDLRLLMWISSFVLLIACANVANLMLARGVTQRQQTAVRAALGAQRQRLVKRALVESVLLSVLGGLSGVLFAYGGAR